MIGNIIKKTGPLILRVLKDRRFWFFMRWGFKPAVTELTRQIDNFVTQGRINKAKKLIRKQANGKADVLRDILNNPIHNKRMNEDTKRLYLKVIEELEGGSQ